MKRRQSIFGTLMFAIIFFVTGLLGYQHLTKPIIEEAKESKKWPITRGFVNSSTLNKTKNSKGNIMYSASIQYSYSVNEKKYKGTNIRNIDGSTSSKSSIKKKLNKYKEGAVVEVHYDPDFPDIAVLEPGTGVLLRALLNLPLLFCFIAVAMILSLIKKMLLG